MADLKKFEEMLERLINEDKEGAEELFHEIVVEKSREIYEGLLEDDLEDEEVDEATDEEVDESDEEVDESDDKEVDESEEDELEEDFDLEEFEVEADPMAAMGGDPADDMMGDIEMGGDEEGDDMDMDDEDEGEEGDMEDRVEDLEDALDDLKAEFEKMMAGEESDDDEEGDDMDMDMDMDADDEEAEEEAIAFEQEEDEVEESRTPKTAGEQMREYVEKVAGGHGAETKGKGEEGGTNTKSAVAGKNDMGGTASNLVQGDEGDVVEAGKGALKGNAVSDTTAKEDDHGNVNVPGGKASKSMKSMPKGHGAEKKGAGETADNKKPTIGG